MSQTIAVELRGVHKSYPAPAGEGITDVLAGVDLQVAAGQSLGIVGPSGSGKSTLLNLIGALDRPTAGTVLLEGRDLAGLNDRQLSSLRNRRIGMIFQLHHLLPQCTAMENVLVPVLAGGKVDKAAADRAGALLERVGLGDHADHRPGQLSGGQRQRVAVARALINDPAILLADEPTGSLDRAGAESVADLLTELARDGGLTLVLATHWTELAARMQSVMTLKGGRLS
ncbi:MAG: ABC transporter ATP-binding protein [Planctomycetaceae bacterium]|nr:ABC transporter ATP-binding protein [Planctomycetaceae bacterium]